MGYPRNVLADGERLVLHNHPQVKCLVTPVLALLLATAVAAFAAGMADPRAWDPTAKNLVLAVVATIWLAIVGRLTLKPFTVWLTTHFVVTDRRVLYRFGVLNRGGIDISLAAISQIEVADRLVERVFRSGTLIIESASQQPWEFPDIPRVRWVHALLSHEVFDNSAASR